MDLLIPFRLAKEKGLTRINVVNKVNSTLARENECGVFLNCGREFSVASTKAFMCQVTVLTLVAIWFAQNKNFNGSKKMRAKLINELKMLSANVKKTLETINDKTYEIAQELKAHKHIFFCGQGLGECIAKEGALKMKELTYLHCQNIKLRDIANNFFCYLKKHKGTPVILIVLDKQEGKREMMDDMEKVHAQTQFTPIIVTDVKDKTDRERLHKFSSGRVIPVQRSGHYMSALLCVIPLQRLAYDLTLALGYHPDKPRNLAKELTTQ